MHKLTATAKNKSNISRTDLNQIFGYWRENI